MKMTKQEYDELIAHFSFLEDKADPGYKRETEKGVGKSERGI